MKNLSKFFYARTTNLVAVGITILTFTYIFLVLQPKTYCVSNTLPEGMQMLGVTFGIDIQAVSDLFISMSVAAFDCYLDSLLIWDMIFPIIYTSMNIALLSVLFRKTVQRFHVWWWLNVFPFLQMILDFAENMFCTVLVKQWLESQDISPILVNSTSIITQFKWITSGIIPFQL